MPEVNKRLAEIIENILVGRYSLHEFYNILPDVVDEGTIYEDIYDDMVTVIEHMPYDYNKKKEKYLKKIEYKTLYLDLGLLKSNYSIEQIIIIRKEVLKQRIDIDFLDKQILYTADVLGL